MVMRIKVENCEVEHVHETHTITTMSVGPQINGGGVDDEPLRPSSPPRTALCLRNWCLTFIVCILCKRSLVICRKPHLDRPDHRTGTAHLTITQCRACGGGVVDSVLDTYGMEKESVVRELPAYNQAIVITGVTPRVCTIHGPDGVHVPTVDIDTIAGGVGEADAVLGLGVASGGALPSGGPTLIPEDALEGFM